jgi:hypothetical protein
MPLRAWAQPIPRSKILLDFSPLRRGARARKNEMQKMMTVPGDISILLSKVHTENREFRESPVNGGKEAGSHGYKTAVKMEEK